MSLVKQAVDKLFQKAYDNKITASRMADATGITRVTLSNWKHGRSRPTLVAFLAVDDALDRMIAIQNDV